MSDKTERWLSFENVAKIHHDTPENLENLVHESSPEKAFRERVCSLTENDMKQVNLVCSG